MSDFLLSLGTHPEGDVIGAGTTLIEEGTSLYGLGLMCRSACFVLESGCQAGRSVGLQARVQ